VGRFDGKVAFITGAARGQGRSHAVRLAEEGADIIAIDICRQVESVPYPMGTKEDLAETVRLVEALGRRIVAIEGDVRDADAMVSSVRTGVGELGRLDIVIANAGITVTTVNETDAQRAYQDTIDVNLTGVRNSVQAAVPSLQAQGTGGSIVIISSTQGLTGRGGTGTGGSDGYVAAKHGLVGLMRSWANWLAPYNIRVNSVHPTGVNTPMVVNDVMREFLEQDPQMGNALANALPVDLVEPVDISNAIVWLVSDDARYVTGVTLPVDAGFTNKK
jgi:SDR family mycofactocin-dependent oxidoreductase